ncbi:MAG: tetratricopeptide repeat protein [Salinivirgaceae bacterium]|jgi:serine phosphatase RsbU (regulator of sigma subunit)|nr:tetratricopeptide repeat protein [Salinivirgaceae bacterium]
MQRIYILIITITLTLGGFAQQKAIDSLQVLINQGTESDTTTISMKQEMAILYYSTQPEKSLKIARETIKSSEEANFPKGISEGHIIISVYFSDNNSLDSAIPHLRKAVNILPKANHKRQLERAYTRLSSAYHNNNMHDSGLIISQKRYELHKNDNNQKLLSAITQKANAYYLLSNLEQAESNAKEGLNLNKQIHNLEIEKTLLNILAATLKRRGEFDSALYYFDKGLEIAQATRDTFSILSAYNNKANIHGDRGNYIKALDNYLLTLKTAEELKHEKAIAVTYNNIAVVYYTLNDYNETISYLLKSIEISKKNDDKQNIANTMNNIAELYLKQDSTASALHFYTNAAVYIRQIKDRQLLTQNYHGKAMVFDKMHQPDSAFHYHKLALKTAKELGARQELAKAYIGMASHYQKKGEIEQASGFAQNAFDIAKNLGKVEIIRDAAEILHQTNAQLVKHKSAYNYLKLFNKMNDSLLNADNTKEIIRIEMQYKHEKEMQVREAQELIKELKQEKELARQKAIRNMFIGAFILLSLFIIQMIRSNRQKQRASQLLSEQKVEIEEKNEELTQLMSEVSWQKDQIEASHTKITDSIRYAQRIQTALFPLKEDLKLTLPEHLIFYKPLEIVSGDFYWIEKIHNHILIAVADCTGHGVPGALMSMLGISFLNDIARQPEVTEPSQVLEKLRRRVKKSLHQTGDVREARDGMDIAFVDIDTSNNTLTYSGANNPMLIYRNDEIIEFKPDRQPIAIHYREKPFVNKYFKLEKGDAIYLFTDGYRDQFGGQKEKKYGSPKFKKLLKEIHQLPIDQQDQILKQEIEKWMQNPINQIDDILIVGFRW